MKLSQGIYGLAASAVLVGCNGSETKELPIHTIEDAVFKDTGVYASGTRVDNDGVLTIQGYEQLSCRSEDGKYAGVFSSRKAGDNSTQTMTTVFVDKSTGLYEIFTDTSASTTDPKDARNEARRFCQDKEDPIEFSSYEVRGYE